MLRQLSNYEWVEAMKLAKSSLYQHTCLPYKHTNGKFDRTNKILVDS